MRRTTFNGIVMSVTFLGSIAAAPAAALDGQTNRQSSRSHIGSCTMSSTDAVPQKTARGVGPRPAIYMCRVSRKFASVVRVRPSVIAVEKNALRRYNGQPNAAVMKSGRPQRTGLQIAPRRPTRQRTGKSSANGTAAQAKVEPSR